MALILPNDGTPSYTITPATQPTWFTQDGMTLTAMQQLVGGYIEHVGLVPAVLIDGTLYTHMVVNEEGKLQGLPLNRAATLIAQLVGRQDVIVGSALLLTSKELQ